MVAEGSVDVYERDGRYQLYARRITLEGAGLLYERFLALKAELEEMGMFAPEYKQPIPAYVRRLGDCHSSHRGRGPGYPEYCPAAESVYPADSVPCPGAGPGSGGEHREGH